jgi:DNA polymerase-3 subunit gamma/tau
MREVAADLPYMPLGEGAIKAVIVDECQNLSKPAFTSLLKVIEDPPKHVYWFLCTTEAGKVPAAIKTRCLSYELKPVPTHKLTALLKTVNVEEQLKINSEIVELCSKEARGSPRQALANFAVCAAAKDLDEAAELLASAEKSAVAFELAQALYRGAGWPELVKVIANLNTENPESVRHVIRAYGTSMLLKSAKNTNSTLAVLEAFATPFNSSDGVTPLLLACGRLTQS